MIQLATRTLSGIVGRTPQRPKKSFGKSVELLGESLLGLTLGSQLLVASRVGCNGLQFAGCQDFAEGVGRARLGRRLALPGPMRQCASAHSTHLLECPKAWRALFLIKKELVAFLERSVVQASGPCGNAQGVCADWSSPCGSRKVKPDQVVVSFLI